MLYTVCTASRATTTGHNEGEWTLDHRHAVFFERKEFMFWDRQIVQVINEGTRGINHDLVPISPRQTFYPMQIHAPILIDRELVGLIMFCE
jgi:hypothetical protein